MSFSMTIDDFVFIEEPVVHYQSPHRVTEVEKYVWYYKYDTISKYSFHLWYVFL